MSIFALTKSERLCSKKQIDDLFKTGRSITEGGFRLVYKFNMIEPEVTPKVLFSVPKKSNQLATRRNLIKRLMKESYRLNKVEFYNWLKHHQMSCVLVIVFSGKEKPDFKLTDDTIKKMFERLLNLGKSQIIKQ